MNDFITIIVADDEPIVRKNFVENYSFEKHGYKIIAEAENGKDALNKCLKYTPDILITDIVMPQMDGLKLISKVKEFLPNIKVILLTCHEDFEYARKAIALGASDYLSKITMSETEIFNALDRTKQEILEDKFPDEMKLNSRKFIEKNIYTLRYQLIMDIINNKYSQNEINLNCNIMGIDLYKAPFYLLALSFIGFDESEKKDLEKVKLLKIIQETKYKNIDVSGFVGNSCDAFVIVYCDSEKELNEYYNHLNDAIYKQSNYNMIAGGSSNISVDATQSINEPLRCAYFEAMSQLKVSFYQLDNGSVCYNSDTQYTFSPWNSFIEKDFDDYLSSLNFEDANIVQELEKAIASRLILNHFFPEDIILWLIRLSTKLLDVDTNVQKKYINKARKLVNIREISSYLAELLIEKNKNIEYKIDIDDIKREEIKLAVKYVRANYSAPIGVIELAEYLEISPNYFSSLFKKETGMGFNSYLCSYRINKAKHMLCETDFNLSQIAEKTGFANDKYFYKLFKKYFKMTPHEYRMKNKH